MLKKEWNDHDRRDKEISEEDWKRLYEAQPKMYQYNPNESYAQTFPSFSGHFSSSSIVTKSDGTTEQKKTIKNSDGSHTEVLTRKNGDECHTTTTITQADGTRTVEETNACPEMNEFNLSVRMRMPDESSLFDKIFKFQKILKIHTERDKNIEFRSAILFHIIAG